MKSLDFESTDSKSPVVMTDAEDVQDVRNVYISNRQQFVHK